MHSSPGGQLPPQIGKAPPQLSGSVVLLVLVVEDVDVVVGSSVVEVDDDVLGASVVEVLEVVGDVVGTSVVEVLDVVDVEEVVGAAVELEVLLLEDDVLVDDELLVDVDVVEVLDVVVLPNVAANPVTSTIELPAPVLQVERNSESGWIGSKTSPNGGAVNPSAKRASVGVIAPPSGRPVTGSMTTRHSWASVKLA